MKIYLLRHAEAENMSTSDHNRRLTAKGLKRTATAATVMVSLGIKPAHIYSSPRVRARQTAELVADAMDMTVELDEEVNFGFSINSVESLIRGLGVDEDVMFVGHEPSMSAVAHGLSGASVVMKKGSLARIDLINRASLRGELVWLIAPKVFDVLGA
jgi:phosphohistidine phosphatase